MHYPRDPLRGTSGKAMLCIDVEARIASEYGEERSVIAIQPCKETSATPLPDCSRLTAYRPTGVNGKT